MTTSSKRVERSQNTAFMKENGDNKIVLIGERVAVIEESTIKLCHVI